MMFKDNFIHGDLHPGNMRVTGVDENGSSSFEPIGFQHVGNPTGEPIKILLLDGGIVTEMTSDVGYYKFAYFADLFQDRKNFIDLFTAIVHKDGYQAGTLMLERARVHVYLSNISCFETVKIGLYRPRRIQKSSR